MNITIQPGRAIGTICAPPSKSMAHRLLICAGLSHGASRISGLVFNEDILATIDCLKALGASCAIDGDTVTVTGIDPRNAVPSQILRCRESGSTLRFFIPLALLCGKTVSLTGTEKLLSRPLGIYAQLCGERGFAFTQTPSMVQIKGNLKGGTYRLPGDISSQFITGLLFALPLTQEDSRIEITTTLESKSYIDLTLQALHTFGIKAWWENEKCICIPGNQQYRSQDMTVEGDYSGAAFFAALNTLGSEVEITGLSPDSLQGDHVYADFFPRLCQGHPEIDITDCPDLGPILFAVAAAKNGAVFTGTRRLKIKESDRSAAMAQELAAFGTEMLVEENSVTIIPTAFHPPQRVLSGHNDHRIVMSLAILLTLTGGEIEGSEAVKKSFPDFFSKLQSLGIQMQ
jgi:3-phosphoshikimate 1-carboxyvinyltransferase